MDGEAVEGEEMIDRVPHVGDASSRREDVIRAPR
jgi:hypothetical protein